MTSAVVSSKTSVPEVKENGQIGGSKKEGDENRELENSQSIPKNVRSYHTLHSKYINLDALKSPFCPYSDHMFEEFCYFPLTRSLNMLDSHVTEYKRPLCFHLKVIRNVRLSCLFSESLLCHVSSLKGPFNFSLSRLFLSRLFPLFRFHYLTLVRRFLVTTVESLGGSAVVVVYTLKNYSDIYAELRLGTRCERSCGHRLLHHSN